MLKKKIRKGISRFALAKPKAGVTILDIPQRSCYFGKFHKFRKLAYCSVVNI